MSPLPKVCSFLCCITAPSLIQSPVLSFSSLELENQGLFTAEDYDKLIYIASGILIYSYRINVVSIISVQLKQFYGHIEVREIVWSWIINYLNLLAIACCHQQHWNGVSRLDNSSQENNRWTLSQPGGSIFAYCFFDLLAESEGQKHRDCLLHSLQVTRFFLCLV